MSLPPPPCAPAELDLEPNRPPPVATFIGEVARLWAGCTSLGCEVSRVAWQWSARRQPQPSHVLGLGRGGDDDSGGLYPGSSGVIMVCGQWAAF
jgi:hypothetical protein